MQIWNYSLSDKKAEIWHFCPWGMRETMTKNWNQTAVKQSVFLQIFFYLLTCLAKKKGFVGGHCKGAWVLQY